MEPSRKEKKLTPKQEKFAQAVASGTSLKESAIMAGYSHKNAARAGAYLANHEPLVQNRIQELQNRGAARAGLTLAKHLDNLEELRDKALENNAFGAAVTAEVSRGKAAGIYVERKELTVNKTSDLTKLEIIERLKELHKESGGVLPVTNYTIEGEKAPDSEPEFENNIRKESKDNSSGGV